MKKIWDFIVSIPKDKFLYGIACALINLFVFAIISRFTVKPMAFLYAFMIALLALVAKTIYNLFRDKGQSFDFWKFIAGLIGVGIIDVALFIIVI